MGDVKQSLPNEAIAALERGSKIDAIKHVRVNQGVGLKEAKEIVEQYLENNPGLKSRMMSANAEAAKGSFKWILLLAVVALVVYYLISTQQ